MWRYERFDFWTKNQMETRNKHIWYHCAVDKFDRMTADDGSKTGIDEVIVR